jgi:hypothetical protein
VLHTALTALTALVCCTGLCSHTASYSIYCTYSACVLYRFVFTQCFIQHLLHLQRSAQPTARLYRYKLDVISPYNCKCRPPHYNIFRVFCEMEHTHAQTDDAQCQFNRRFAQGTVLKWRQEFWACPWESRDTTVREFWIVTGCLFMKACISFLINSVKVCWKHLHFSHIVNWGSR